MKLWPETPAIDPPPARHRRLAGFFFWGRRAMQIDVSRPPGIAWEFHEAANLFPLDEEYLDELAADIHANGQQDAIELQDGKILDGRRRYLACQRAGVEPKFREVQVADPVAYVLSKNLHRRHLDASQRAMVAARAREWYDRQAKERQRVRKGNQPGATQKNLPGLSKGQARDQAGQAVGVSGKSVDQATKVRREGVPELTEAVEGRRLPVSTAAAVAGLPEAEQRRVLADPNLKRAAREAVRRAEAEAAAHGPDSDGEARACPGGEEGGCALARVNEALTILAGIPPDDPQRQRAFRTLRDWLRDNRIRARPKKDSNRVKTFTALAKHPSGMTRGELAKALGLRPNNGGLGRILRGERCARRIKREDDPRGGPDKYYYLTAKGGKHLQEGKVDSYAREQRLHLVGRRYLEEAEVG
jgi:ParB-like chromosome segregation protein Spo0J